MITIDWIDEENSRPEKPRLIKETDKALQGPTLLEILAVYRQELLKAARNARLKKNNDNDVQES